jgi:hypothetical protein
MLELTFSAETLYQVEEEIQPLLLENWGVVAVCYPESTFAPSMQVYRDLDAAGRLGIFTVRYEGRLVGHAIVFHVNPPHRSLELVGVVDAFFIQEAYRKGGSALAFLRYVEESLAELGLQALYFGSRDPLVCRWMKSIARYDPAESVFERRL